MNIYLSGNLLTFQDMLEQFKTVYWWNLDLQQEDKKIISLILFAVVLDHRKSLTDPLPAFVPELIWLMNKAMGCSIFGPYRGVEGKFPWVRQEHFPRELKTKTTFPRGPGQVFQRGDDSLGQSG